MHCLIKVVLTIPRLPGFHMEQVTILLQYMMGNYDSSISYTCLLHDLFLYSVIISTVMKLWQPTEYMHVVKITAASFFYSVHNSLL